MSLSDKPIGEVGAITIAAHHAQLIGRHLGSFASYVDENGIGDASSRAIAERLPRLEALGATNASIGNAGANAIAHHLPNPD